MPPAARSRARWTPARSPCSGSRPPPRRTGASASGPRPTSSSSTSAAQTAARPRRRLAATQDADARPPSPSAMSDARARAWAACRRSCPRTLTEPAGRPTGACWSGGGDVGASRVDDGARRLLIGGGDVGAARVRRAMAGMKPPCAPTSSDRRRPEPDEREHHDPGDDDGEHVPWACRPDMTTSCGPRWRCAMLGGAAIRSLSVRHPCRSSSASSARSRSSAPAAPVRLGGPRQRAVLADPAAERQPRRLDRPARRRALRRRAAGDRRHADPAPGLRPAQASSARRSRRGRPATCVRVGPRDARPGARSSGWRRTGRRRARRGDARERAAAQLRDGARACGAGRRSPTSPSSRSRRRRSRGSRSCASTALEARIEADLGSASTAGSSPSSRRSSASTRRTSASTPS